MSLQAVVENLDGVDEAFHSLYTERDGKFEITGIEGMRTSADVDRVQEALRKERTVSSGYKTKLGGFGDRTPEAIEELDHQIEDLNTQLDGLKREGGPNEEDLNKLVETRSVARIRPIERNLLKVSKQLEEITGERNALASERTRGSVIAAVERAAQSKDVLVEKEVLASGDIADWAARAFEIVDGEIVSREGVPGVSQGLTPDQVFLDMKETGTRSYWFGATKGAGASGGKGGDMQSGENPFAINKETGRPNNMTKAGQLLKSDPVRAGRLFAAAGKKAEQFFPHLSKK
ncbi:hypothetical protein LCGC14_0793480 [marine sediment metagenome]|uniref:Uncharacterized protein n=1 Tax=marine sediment metagenome TaxID=412755 RepID=A0A0F9PW45_9ZZZZ